MITTALLHWASLNLLTPWGLAAALLVAVIVGFYFAPNQTLQVLVNWRTWAIVAVVGVVLGYHQLQAQNATLAAQNTALSAKVDTIQGATASLEAKLDSQKQATVQIGRLKDVARKAPEGQKEDAVLDQVAADDAAAAQAPAAAPAPGGTSLDRVLDHIVGAGPGKPHP